MTDTSSSTRPAPLPTSRHWWVAITYDEPGQGDYIEYVEVMAPDENEALELARDVAIEQANIDGSWIISHDPWESGQASWLPTDQQWPVYVRDRYTEIQLLVHAATGDEALRIARSVMENEHNPEPASEDASYILGEHVRDPRPLI